MRSVEKVGMQKPRYGRAVWWIALPVALLGYFAIAELFGIASRFRNPDLVVIAGALVGVPAAVLLVLAIGQGISQARTMSFSLKW